VHLKVHRLVAKPKYGVDATMVHLEVHPTARYYPYEKNSVVLGECIEVARFVWTG
jgi:hypothetical protein